MPVPAWLARNRLYKTKILLDADEGVMLTDKPVTSAPVVCVVVNVDETNDDFTCNTLPPLAAVAQDGTPDATVSTCPLEPMPSLAGVFAAEA